MGWTFALGLQSWQCGRILSFGYRLSSSSDLSTLQPSAQAAQFRSVTCRPAYPRPCRFSRLWLSCSRPLGAGRRNSHDPRALRRPPQRPSAPHRLWKAGCASVRSSLPAPGEENALHRSASLLQAPRSASTNRLSGINASASLHRTGPAPHGRGVARLLSDCHAAAVEAREGEAVEGFAEGSALVPQHADRHFLADRH